MKVFRDIIVPIFNADGTPYTDTGNNKAILIYAKIRSGDSGENDPYDWWDEDNHGGANAFVGGTFGNAQLSYVGEGIWKKRMESDILDAENADREDYYFVKIGDQADYSGWNDVDWTLVDGYDPVAFSTILLTPKLILGMLNEKVDFHAIVWDEIEALLDADGDIISAKADKVDVKDLLDSDNKFITEEGLINKMIDGTKASNALLADFAGGMIGNSKMAAMIGANMAIADQFPVYLPVTSGAGPPTSIPSRICQLYLDTDTKEVWVATGTTASTDWALIPPRSGSDDDFDTDEVHDTGIEGTEYGQLIVRESTGTEACIFLIAGQTIEKVSGDVTFTITKDTVSSYNVYWETDQFKIQNKVGDDKNMKWVFQSVE